jgi:hypothetical protein
MLAILASRPGGQPIEGLDARVHAGHGLFDSREIRAPLVHLLQRAVHCSRSDSASWWRSNGFALDALNLGQMTIEVVLEAFGARELDVDGLQRLEAGADVRKERRRRFVNLGEVPLVLDHGVLFVLDRCRAPARVGQACLNLRHLIWQAGQPRLRTLQRRELLLGVDDLGGQAVAGDPCLFEIRLAVNLCGKPVIDVAAEIVQRPQAGMHLLHEREPRREEIQPAGELLDLRTHRDRPLRHVAGVGDPRS